jgi:hypothetical protein
MQVFNSYLWCLELHHKSWLQIYEGAKRIVSKSRDFKIVIYKSCGNGIPLGSPAVRLMVGYRQIYSDIIP